MPGSPIGSGTGPTVSFDKLTTKPTPNIPMMRRVKTERRSNDSSYNVITGAEFSGSQYVEPCIRSKNPEKFYEGAGAGRKAFTEKMIGSIKGIDQGSCAPAALTNQRIHPAPQCFASFSPRFAFVQGLFPPPSVALT
jgi:hypothetical protein